MKKYFNTAGICYPDEHYMVNMDSRLQEIAQLIERGEYITLHKARQYGKTTTLHLLTEQLAQKYAIFSISFEGISENTYTVEASFVKRICGLFYNALLYGETDGISKEAQDVCKKMSNTDLKDSDLFSLSNLITKICMEAEKPVVLFIDEVDQASNQEIFLSFLGMLRDKYLKRKRQPTFQSVILASVYDIKNLRLKMRPASEHLYNSPWNIAADFNVDMNFCIKDIAGMLDEYNKDNHIKMDVLSIAKDIFDYTFGYPFLVSRICKIMDEILPKRNFNPVWTHEGVIEAIKELLLESNTLFDDMIKKLNDFPELKKMLYSMLFQGEKFLYNADSFICNIGLMFGFLKNSEGMIALSNRIFETRLYNLFLSEDLITSKIYKSALLDKNQFIKNKELDMERILMKFTEAFTEIYSDEDDSFLEENGRRFFLLYLKPIINGIGNYYIEARTRNMRRTDIIIDYLGKQYVCELKIWHGKEYHERGEKQLIDYLNYYHLKKGYMLSFNFNKKKEIGVKRIKIEDKVLVEAVV